VFWHRPRPGTGAAEYERAQLAFHASLSEQPPAGMCSASTYRVADLPWLDGPAYEDWYLLEDYSALGELAEQAVAPLHRAAHDGAARGFGHGAGGLYALRGGDVASAGAGLDAYWITRPFGSGYPPLAELLDGDAGGAGLWRRQLVFGPAPELCLLCARGSSTHLPDGWSVRHAERRAL